MLELFQLQDPAQRVLSCSELSYQKFIDLGFVAR